MSSPVPLTLKYRPRRFSDVVGQTAARLVLQQMVRTGDVRPALLFYGSHGCGKTSAARVFSAALNCEAEDPDQRPCGECTTCISISTGMNSDVTEIDAASSGLADDMRSLREQVRFAAHARYRTIILDEVHAMSSKGFQALLKTLEEPPLNTVFILVTTELGKVPDTIVSRCLSCEFRRLTDVQISNRVRYIADLESIPVTDELCRAIASRARGIARNAVSLLEQCSLVHVQTPDHLSTLLGDDDHGIRVVRALVSGDYEEAFAASERALAVLPAAASVVAAIVRTLRRTLVLTASEGGVSLSPPPSSAEKALAGMIDSGRCVAALKVVWEYYSKVAPAADAYAALDLLVTLLGQSLVIVSSSRPKGTLSTGDLRAMVR